MLMEHTLVAVLVGAGCGALAGVAFAGGLAATVERLGAARRPALLVAGSLALRLALVAAALAAVAAWLPPVGLVAAAGGLVVGRAAGVARLAARWDGEAPPSRRPLAGR
jgi:F1F0 ATPase subunit 2